MKRTKFKTKSTNLNATNKTIAEGIEEFKRNCIARNLSSYTIRYYDNIIHTMQLCFDFDMQIKDITETFWDEYIFFMQQRNCKDTTVASNAKGVRTILYFFMEKEYMINFQIHLPKADEPLKKIYSEAEIEKLLKKPNIKDCCFSELRSWAMVVYFVGTGQRLRTVLGLRIKDIDFENNLVTLTNVKNRKHTILPLSAKVVEVLQMYLEIRGGEPDDFLFCSWDGLELTKRGAEEAIWRYNSGRGVGKTSIHAFRHTFATNYLKAGGDVFRLQRLMCHSNINVTKEYIHLTNADLAENMDNLTLLKNMSLRKIKMK